VPKSKVFHKTCQVGLAYSNDTSTDIRENITYVQKICGQVN
jgi:hypothetical protein